MEPHSQTLAREPLYLMLTLMLLWIRAYPQCTYAGVERGSINGMGCRGAPYLLVHHKQLGLQSFQLPWIISLARSQSQRKQATSCTSVDCLQTQHGTQ